MILSTLIVKEYWGFGLRTGTPSKSSGWKELPSSGLLYTTGGCEVLRAKLPHLTWKWKLSGLIYEFRGWSFSELPDHRAQIQYL
jgi:hypothetical protein